MGDPRTPTKSGEAIEQIKTLLAAQWRLRFPFREAISSPSSRDRESVEEKVHEHLNFLWFKDQGMINEALTQFKADAPCIISQWQHKPDAEPDLLPQHRLSAHRPQRDFLHRRADLDDETARKLMQHLEHLLSDKSKAYRNHDTNAIPEETPNGVKQRRNVPVSREAESPSNHSSSIPRRSLRLASNPAPATSSRVGTNCAVVEEPPNPTPEEFNNGLSDEDLAQLHLPLEPLRLTSIHCQDESMDSGDDEPTVPDTPSRRGRNSTSRTSHSSATHDASARREAEHDGRTTRILRAESNGRPPSWTLPSTNANNRSPRKNGAYLSAPNHARSRDQSTSSFNSALNSGMTSVSHVASFTSASSTTTSPKTSFSRITPMTSFESIADNTGYSVRQNLSNPGLYARGSREPQMSFSHNPRIFDQATNQNPQSAANPMDIDSLHAAQKLPPVALGSFQPSHLELLEADAEVVSRLNLNSPFSSAFMAETLHLRFRQVYEVFRVASHCEITTSDLSPCLTKSFDDYESLWSSLRNIAASGGRRLPEKSSLDAWNRAGQGFERVSLSGKLKFSSQKTGRLFDLSLGPLKIEASCRFTRKFGSDRFLVITIPTLGSDDVPASFQTATKSLIPELTHWLVDGTHHFLGRKWRPFFVKAVDSRKWQKGSRPSNDQPGFRLWLFAEDGDGFLPSPNPILGQVNRIGSTHTRMTVTELIEWFMPSRNNARQSYLKYFARLALGMTPTVETIAFDPEQILLRDDALSDRPCRWEIDLTRSDEKKTGRNVTKNDGVVMNDGCSRLSKTAAAEIARMLKLQQVPSVFQGRIAGAKGIWMVDTLGEENVHLGKGHWIEITDSQLKFQGHPGDARRPDPARVTLDVGQFSRPLSSTTLNYQLMPILLARGVPVGVFGKLLRDDLKLRIEELQTAMEDGLALRKWNQISNRAGSERLQNGGIEMLGGIPASKIEKINFLVDHGFKPREFQYLADLVQKEISAHCLQLKSKMNVALGQSTQAYMIADPLGVLEENEIHLAFSQAFNDQHSGFCQTMLHDLDVLVARLPAHLPSDIQKVHAVFKPELRDYKDVVVFSSKGPVPLASKLSGGDYDGDRAWICWDESIVHPFQNVDQVPHCPEPDFYGIKTDKRQVKDILPSLDQMNHFLKLAFNFTLRSSVLGICTNYHEALCYHENTIESPRAIQIASMLGYLVDSAKSGFVFSATEWGAYLKKAGLPPTFPKPAYKDPDRVYGKPESLLDDLRFNVANKEIAEALRRFGFVSRDCPADDRDLTRIRDQEIADSRTDPSLKQCLNRLEDELTKLLDYWKRHGPSFRDEDEDNLMSPIKNRGRKRALGEDGYVPFPAVVQKCRDDFLAIAPFAVNTEVEGTSTLVKRWAREHSQGRRSHWDLVKASFAFHKHRWGPFVWYMCGLELGEIKATASGRGSYRAVTSDVYNAMKLDGRMVDKIRSENQADLKGVDLAVLAVLGALAEDVDEYGEGFDFFE